jgi:peptidoglycan/LPS O-acetylase OafA/YrhL
VLLNIQFLRFVAAMLVVLYHTASQVPESESLIHGLFFLGQAVGFAGVDIFFVISGFIMAYTTMEHGGARDSAAFAKRRLARIFSGHWPFFALTLLVFYWLRPAHFEESNLLASFFLWPQPLNRTLLEITWTLSFELYFYLLFTLVVWLVPAGKRMATCLLITAALLLLNLYRHFVLASFEPENLYFIPFAVHFLVSPFMLEFFAGTLVAYWLRRNPAGLSTAWLLSGLFLFLASGAVNYQSYSGVIEQGFHVVPRVFWFGLSSVMIVAGLVRLEYRSIKSPARFSLRTGGASYAIYLGHILILTIAGKLGMPGFVAQLPFGLATICYLLLMLLILVYSVWHYEKIERPLHRVFKHWIGIRQVSNS